MLDLITHVVTAEDVAYGKPHPAGFLLACERLSVQPAATLAAEDSVAGIAAAVAAGVGHVVGVTTSKPGDDLLAAGAHAAYADLRAVVRHLAREA